jgi:signal transduction histidine kinase
VRERLIFPYDGIFWSRMSGAIEWVDPQMHGPGGLRMEDVIQRIDGVALGDYYPMYRDKLPGDRVSIEVLRKGEPQEITILLAQPPAAQYIVRLIPILLALAFWGTGLLILAYHSDTSLGYLFCLVCLVASSLLITGSISNMVAPWAHFLFVVSLWWLPPLLVHLHFYFPVRLGEAHSLRWTLPILYGVPLLGCLLYPTMPRLLHQEVSTLVYSLYWAWILLGAAAVPLLLGYAYWKQHSVEVRRRVGWIVSGVSWALLAFILLSLLPDAVFGKPTLYYEYSMGFLLVIPFTYGYGILQYRFIHLDKYVNRLFVSGLAATLLLVIWVLLFAGVTRLFPFSFSPNSMTGFALILFLAVIFQPLHSWLHTTFNRLFYGNWYSQNQALEQVSRTISRRNRESEVVQVLIDDIRKTMQAECACLLSANGAPPVCSLTTRSGECICGSQDSANRVEELKCFFDEKAGTVGPDGQRTERLSLANIRLTDEERRVAGCARAVLAVPMWTDNAIRHWLILGPRVGGKYQDSDLVVLSMVIPQASMLLENLDLVEALRQQVKNLEKMHHEMLDAREQERKRVARELHDNIIQALVGFNYELTQSQGLDFNANGELTLREKLREVIDDVRKICSDLRPPSLDNLGAVSAVRAIIRERKKSLPCQIQFMIDGDENQPTSEAVALCLYRVVQEALVNIEKHAQARRVWVSLVIRPHEITLTVDDDGIGFKVPGELSHFAGRGHFGLMGVQERVELLEGEVEIYSDCEKGTQLMVTLPLQPSPVINIL